MHCSTEARKLVAVQIQAASVVAQPVAPMALVAQVSAQLGRLDKLWEAASSRRAEKPRAATERKRMLAVLENSVRAQRSSVAVRRSLVSVFARGSEASV